MIELASPLSRGPLSCRKCKQGNSLDDDLLLESIAMRDQLDPIALPATLPFVTFIVTLSYHTLSRCCG